MERIDLTVFDDPEVEIVISGLLTAMGARDDRATLDIVTGMDERLLVRSLLYVNYRVISSLLVNNPMDEGIALTTGMMGSFQNALFQIWGSGEASQVILAIVRIVSARKPLADLERYIQRMMNYSPSVVAEAICAGLYYTSSPQYEIFLRAGMLRLMIVASREDNLRMHWCGECAGGATSLYLDLNDVKGIRPAINPARNAGLDFLEGISLDDWEIK